MSVEHNNERYTVIEQYDGVVHIVDTKDAITVCNAYTIEGAMLVRDALNAMEKKNEHEAFEDDVKKMVENIRSRGKAFSKYIEKLRNETKINATYSDDVECIFPETTTNMQSICNMVVELTKIKISELDKWNKIQEEESLELEVSDYAIKMFGKAVRYCQICGVEL